MSDGAIRLWDCKTWRLANVAELDSSIRTIAFERNNAALLVGFNNGVAAVLRFSEIVS